MRTGDDKSILDHMLWDVNANHDNATKDSDNDNDGDSDDDEY